VLPAGAPACCSSDLTPTRREVDVKNSAAFSSDLEVFVICEAP